MTTYSKTSKPRKIINTLRVYIFSQGIVVWHQQGRRPQTLPLKEGFIKADEGQTFKMSALQSVLNNNSYGPKLTHLLLSFVEHLPLPT